MTTKPKIETWYAVFRGRDVVAIFNHEWGADDFIEHFPSYTKAKRRIKFTKGQVMEVEDV